MNATDSKHGVFIEVSDVGVLLLGRSGIGKSECALDLLTRGHRLVADDLVLFRKDDEGNVLGRATALSKGYIEVRGLGILNVSWLFGDKAVLEEHHVHLAIYLSSRENRENYDRAGTEREYIEILHQQIPCIRIPIGPGRSTAAVIEVAARNEKLRWSGMDSASVFSERQKRVLCDPS